MKKLFIAIFIIAVSVVVFAGCRNESSDISDELGIDISEGTEVVSEDSHSGFHNDGTSFVVLSIEDDSVLNVIANNKSWNALPMSENVTALVYSVTYEDEDGEISVGPYLTDDNGDALIPEIENGYYYFCDRHSESTDSADDSEVLNRGSFNFTVAVYDKDTNYLYYAKLDT